MTWTGERMGNGSSRLLRMSQAKSLVRMSEANLLPENEKLGEDVSSESPSRERKANLLPETNLLKRVVKDVSSEKLGEDVSSEKLGEDALVILSAPRTARALLHLDRGQLELRVDVRAVAVLVAALAAEDLLGARDVGGQGGRRRLRPPVSPIHPL